MGCTRRSSWHLAGSGFSELERCAIFVVHDFRIFVYNAPAELLNVAMLCWCVVVVPSGTPCNVPCQSVDQWRKKSCLWLSEKKTHEQKAFSGKIYLSAGSFDNFETLPYRAGIPTPQRQPTRRCRWILFLSIQRRAQFSQRHLLLLLLLLSPPTMQCHETTQHTAQHGDMVFICVPCWDVVHIFCQMLSYLWTEKVRKYLWAFFILSFIQLLTTQKTQKYLL